jgi:hypothetical protein
MLDVRAGRTVPDVAIGDDNASLAAARRWCDVVATDTGLPAGKRSSCALPEGRVFKVESPSTEKFPLS